MASNNLTIQVLLKAVDKASVPLNAIKRATQSFTEKVKDSRTQLAKLEKININVAKFNEAKQKAKEFAQSLNNAEIQAKELKNALEANQSKLNSTNGKIDNAKKAVLNYRAEIKALQLVIRNTKDVNIKGDSKQKIEALRNTIKATRETVKLYRQETKDLDNEQKNLTLEFSQNQTAVKRLKNAYSQQVHKLKELQQSLVKSGVKTGTFGQHQQSLQNQINKTNRKLKEQQKSLNSINNIKRSAVNIKNSVASAQNTAMLGFGAMQAGRAILNPVMKMGQGVAGMAQTAGKFEQFQSILEITEGSSEKAQQSFDWVKKFAVDTPSNLDDAMEAFVKLRAYGLDPTNGLLMTLGDTAAAMGKPVMQAVEAIADAVTGENERLKEFGIKGAAIKGTNFIEYAYTDKTGKQKSVKVDKTNRKQIEETLNRIFNEKYTGAMEKQSKTLMGIWAKLEDQWTNFQMLIMQTGAFDWIKDKLQGVLDSLDKMSQNGELQKWAEDIGSVIKEVAVGLWDFGKIIGGMIQKVAQFARENKGVIATIIKWSAVIGVALTAIAPFIFALSAIVPAITTVISSVSMLESVFSLVGQLFLTNPILLVIAAIIAAIYLLWQNWESVCQWISEKWTSLWNGVSAFFSEVWTNLTTFFNSGIGNISATILNWSPLGLFYKAFASVMSWFGVDLPNDFSDFGAKMMNSLTEGIKNGINFVSEAFDGIKKKITEKWDSIVNSVSEGWSKVKNTVGGWFGVKSENKDTPPKEYARGGFTGHGGTYDPAGIVHKGEYVMTKVATARLGVANLNRLNYGGANAIRVDSRPPISAPSARGIAGSITQHVAININGANADQSQLERMIQRALENANRKAQAQQRSLLLDRG